MGATSRDTGHAPRRWRGLPAAKGSLPAAREWAHLFSSRRPVCDLASFGSPHFCGVKREFPFSHIAKALLRPRHSRAFSQTTKKGRPAEPVRRAPSVF